MDKFTKKLKFVDYYIQEVFDILKSNDSQNNRNKFAKICDIVAKADDAFVAYVFADRISIFLNADYKKIFDLKRFENIVLKSNDEELMYKFAANVVGANAKHIAGRLHDKYYKDKLLHDVNTISNENSL